MAQPAGRSHFQIERFSTHAVLLGAWALLYGLSFPAPGLWPLAHLALAPLTLLAIYGRPQFTFRRTGLIPAAGLLVVGAAGLVTIAMSSVMTGAIGLVWPVVLMMSAAVCVALGVGWAALIFLGGGSPWRVRLLLVYIAAWVWWVVMLRWMMPVTDWGTLALCCYEAIYPLLFAVLIRLIDRQLRLPLTFTVPVVWTALEYLRGQVLLSGFPWFYIGHSQPVVMIQIADVVGASGVSFIVAMTGGLVCDLVTRPLVRTGPGEGVSPLRLALPVWAAVMTLTLGYGLYRCNPPVDGPTIHIAVVQSNVPQSNKDSGRAEDDEAIFAQLMELSAAAVGGEPRADLIVWPETMVPRAINDESMALYLRLNPALAKYRQEIEAFASRRGVHMMVGAHAMVGWRETPDRSYRPARRYNSAYFVTPRSGVAGRYDKVHRVPFGEYIPWLDDFPTLRNLALSLTPGGEGYTLTPGSEWIRFEMDVRGQAWRIAAPICFEDVMAYVPRQMVYGAVGNDGRKRVDLLVNLTNDGWFAGTSQSVQHEQIARFRCVENRVPAARSVNTGVSGVLDSCGRLVARVQSRGKQTDVAGVSVASVTYDRRTTVFGRVGDAFAVACTIAWVCLIGWVAIGKLTSRARAGGRAG